MTEPPLSVHILRHGLALCGAIHGIRGGWGPSLKWIGFNHPQALEHATCPTCKQALELMQAADAERNLPERQA